MSLKKRKGQNAHKFQSVSDFLQNKKIKPLLESPEVDGMKVENSKQNEGNENQIKMQSGSNLPGGIDKEDLKFQLQIVDHQKPGQLYPLKLLQELTNFLLSESTINPLWVVAEEQLTPPHQNKDQLENLNFLFIKNNREMFTQSLEVNDTPFFKNIMEDKANFSHLKCNFISRNPSYFWNNLFSEKSINSVTKTGAEKINPQKKEEDQNQQDEQFSADKDPDTFNLKQAAGSSQQFEHLSDHEQFIYKLYSKYCLTETQLQFNLYPLIDNQIYPGFQSTEESESEQEFSNMILSIDCEMVLELSNNEQINQIKFVVQFQVKTVLGSELARVTIINYKYEILLDSFVMPEGEIVDYLTQFSGITPEILQDVNVTIKDVHEFLQKKINKHTILVGQSLENDLMALKLVHRKIIDTSVLFSANNNQISLKNLSFKYLNLKIQGNNHDSLEDAKAALSLAKMKIQILSNFQEYVEKKDNNEFNLLQKLLQTGQSVMVIDEPDNVQSLTPLGVHSQEIKPTPSWSNSKNKSQC